MPSTLVLIGLKSPRMLEGASGLGSQMSMWLGPPWRKIMKTDFARASIFVPAFAEAASSLRNSGALNPSNDRPPARNNSRRDQPSQVRPGRPGIESMAPSLLLLYYSYSHKDVALQPHGSPKSSRCSERWDLRSAQIESAFIPVHRRPNIFCEVAAYENTSRP